MRNAETVLKVIQEHAWTKNTGEPDDAKVSRPVCAVRRVITSPVQPGNTRRRCLGYQLTRG